MKRSILLFLAVGLVFAGMLPAVAQEQAPSGPPKMLQIFREEVKPGKAPAHAPISHRAEP